ncbi:MAG: DUF3090 family protein [Dehalococcoidia bacterium]
MPRAIYEFGLVSRLDAEAMGEPGKRTFRLLVDSPAGSAILWLEKEQLLELSLSIKRAVGMLEAELAQAPPPGSAPVISEDSLGGEPVEFKVGKQAMEYDREAQVFRFWSHDVEDGEDSDAKLAFDATSDQVTRLSDDALSICAAGRPICPLCHQPINPEGHFCSRSNGHPPDATDRLE